MKKNSAFVGIDNGVTGSIGIVYSSGAYEFYKTPVFITASYTKEVKYIHRIDWVALKKLIPNNSYVFLERPMINPRAWTATQSALRALESTLIVFEMLGVVYTYIDSKEWQQQFISSAIIGHEDMKEASKIVAMELFPQCIHEIAKHGDGDGLLIAQYGKDNLTTI